MKENYKIEIKAVENEPDDIDWRLLEALNLEVNTEIFKAIKEHGHFASPASGIAVIRREFEELWEAFWKNPRSRYHVKTEAVQVAAMALTLIHDWFPVLDKDALTDLESLDSPYQQGCGESTP